MFISYLLSKLRNEYTGGYPNGKKYLWILFAFSSFGIIEEIIAKQTEIAVAIV